MTIGGATVLFGGRLQLKYWIGGEKENDSLSFPLSSSSKYTTTTRRRRRRRREERGGNYGILLGAVIWSLVVVARPSVVRQAGHQAGKDGGCNARLIIGRPF